MKKQNTRRALLMSALSILLCVSMLVGTTFAWFTDEVKSGTNQIIAGNLDVDVVTADGVSIQDKKTLFDEIKLWEPGVVAYENLTVKNLGNLTLKYQMEVNFENASQAKNGKTLADALKVAIVPGGVDGALTREALVASLADKWQPLESFVQAGVLDTDKDLLTDAKIADTYGLVIYWEPTAADNDFNMNNAHQGTVLTIDLGVRLVATQMTAELDSWGSDYDKDAKIANKAGTLTEVLTELAAGNNVLLQDIIIIDGDAMAEIAAFQANMRASRATTVVDKNAIIDGDGGIIFRTAEMADKPIFQIEEGYTLTLSNITIDGGAKWEGEVNAVLQRPTTNVGIVTTGAIVTMSKNSHLVLNEGAVLQNNDGANAVFLNTRVGATLTLNGGEIINNHSAAGAIWGGGAITINSGKVNGNHGGIGGAIRAVTNIGTLLTMNGGEMNHNLSDSVGGAIWAGSSRSNNVYVLNGGEMAYNYSPETGGAIYAGYYETVKIGGTFKMHDNDCAANIGAAIRFHDHASLVMTGGEVYNNGDNANALYLNNNSASITGGKIVGDFGYSGGLGLTWGNAEVDGVLTYNLATNHNTAYLAAEFGTLKFIVTEGANFAAFNFKPAAGYTYTEGDEAKLICLNPGYTTYWDAATASFRLMAN